MPTPSEMARRLNVFVEKALGENLVLDINTHLAIENGPQKKRITWQSFEPFDILAHPLGTIDEYLYFLRERHFSFVTMDGSIIQITYDIRRGDFVSHRLSYIPCPIDLDADLLELDTLDNIVEDAFINSPRSEIRLRSSLRFDYDPEASSAQHPASHLTFNYDSVRIPVKRIVDTESFLTFVWSNFFVPRKAVSCASIPFASDVPFDVLDSQHRLRPHISWDLD